MYGIKESQRNELLGLVGREVINLHICAGSVSIELDGEGKNFITLMGLVELSDPNITRSSTNPLVFGSFLTSVVGHKILSVEVKEPGSIILLFPNVVLKITDNNDRYESVVIILKGEYILIM